MIRSRFGLKAIGLCLALAGLMAVGAGSAQAEVGAKWLVAGTTVTTLLPELQGTLENSHGQLLGEIAGVGIHILCTSIALVATNHLLAEGGWLGKILFNGCEILRLKTLNNPATLELLKPCLPKTLGVNDHIVTNQLKGLIRLHLLLVKEIIEGKEVTLDLGLDTIFMLEPNEGTIFTTIETGEECAFGEKIKVEGKFALKDCANAFLTDQVTHLLEEFAPLTELYLNGNKANKGTLDGSTNVSLAGVHKGLTWAGHPG